MYLPRLMFTVMAGLATFFLVACDEQSSSRAGPDSMPASTQTNSHAFKDLKSKQEFLERYVRFRRHYQKLYFDISFYNNSANGRVISVPGPNDWSITIIAKVPKSELKLWTENLKKGPSLNVEKWAKELNSNINITNLNEWYQSDYVSLGIDRSASIIFYSNSSNRF